VAVQAVIDDSDATTLPSIDIPRQRVVVTRLCEATAAARVENDLAEALRRVDRVEKVVVVFVHWIAN
jgi:hypothetical protein